MNGEPCVISCRSSATLWAVLLLLPGIPVAGADDQSLASRIDGLIEAKFGDSEPAPVSNDAEFLRRIWLDLAGRIPTAAETRSFLIDASADKRAKQIDRLLAAPTYVQRMQELFNVVLMERRGENEKWAQYLRTAFEQNRHWDQIVRELLHPDVNDPTRSGAGYFFSRRIEPNGQNPIDYPGLTRDVGRLFLGTDLQCAQCHNHLFIDDYKQLDFQGLYSVFLNLSVKNGLEFPAVTEKPMAKKLEFVSVFDPTQHETGPRIPFGKEIGIPEPSTEGTPVSVLALISDELPRPENTLFSRNIANRLWFVMMGRGLVHPLDLNHSGNPPSHPELLDLLASEFAAHQYDVKWLLRELALTQTYQRSSRYPVADGEPGDPARYANIPPQSYMLSNEKRLLAEQLLCSTLQATGNLDRLQQPVEDGKPNPAFTDLRAKYVAAFANEPKEPEDEINHTVKGALFTLNDDKSLELLTRQPGNLMDRLMMIDDHRVLAEELYLSIFTREPSEAERAELDGYLQQHVENKEKALGIWAWSMLTSMEFVVNH